MSAAETSACRPAAAGAREDRAGACAAEHEASGHGFARHAPHPTRFDDYILHFFIDYDRERVYAFCHPRSMRGRVLEAILKAERGRRSRGCVRSAGPGGSETAHRALRPGARSSQSPPAGNGGSRSADPSQKIAGWSAERCSVSRRRRRAPRQAPVSSDTRN
jgi:hypothetical protein